MELVTSKLYEVTKEIMAKSYCITSILKIDDTILHKYSNYWADFSSSWNNLYIDKYMADGGKYRFRRYSVFNWRNFDKVILSQPIQPHYQKMSYNSLNGGVYRYYKPFEEHIISNPLLSLLIKYCIEIFHMLVQPTDWHIECHQFRIVATSKSTGLPTPEGLHRDGVDYIFIMMVKKENITGGETSIYSTASELLHNYTLEDAFDCILADDHKIMHAVSPIHKIEPESDAYRDVLVLTFRKRAIDGKHFNVYPTFDVVFNE